MKSNAQSQDKDHSKDSQISYSGDVDVSLIEYNLSLSYEQRLLNHQRALDTVIEIQKAGEKIYGKKPLATS